MMVYYGFYNIKFDDSLYIDRIMYSAAWMYGKRGFRKRPKLWSPRKSPKDWLAVR